MISCRRCFGLGELLSGSREEGDTCPSCGGTGEARESNASKNEVRMAEIRERVLAESGVSETTVKRVPQDQHDLMVDLGLFWIQNQTFAIVSTDENRKLGNKLLNRGFVMRGEFDGKRFGYKPLQAGLDYLVATEPDTFFFNDEVAA